MTTPTLSVIMPCWNGRHLLEANLPSVITALGQLDVPHELLIVDDASTDGLAEWLRATYPTVHVLRHARNQGFSAAIRTGVAAAQHAILYFLNSDVRVEPQTFRALLPHFADETVCAVASLDVAQEACRLPAITNHWGLLGVRYVPVPTPTTASPLLFATGGHAAYAADKFRALGGFDDLFHPVYWEDIDLCVRAHARGWRVLLEPSSRVVHHVGSSMTRRFSQRRIAAIRAAHRWLFTLRHAPSVGPGAVAALVAAHGWAAAATAMVTGWRRAAHIHRAPAAARPVLQRYRVAAVKHRHQVPWTVLYTSPTGEIAGGGELSLLTLLGALDRTRVRPLLLCPTDGVLAQRARATGIDVHVMSLPHAAVGLLSGSVLRLTRWLQEEGVDLIHANAAGRPLLLPGLAGRPLGIPLIWHARIATPEPLVDRLEGRLAQRIIATSALVAAKFRTPALQQKVVTIPNPVDLAQFRPDRDGTAWRARHGLPQEAVLGGLFGRFDRWKRFELAVQALAQIHPSAPQLRLVFVGDGPQRATLEQEARLCGIADYVHFVGWDNDPAGSLAAMDVVVHPTPGEHFGRVLIEALACGKPLIADASGGAAALLAHEHTALLVPAQNVEALGAALRRLARDSALRVALGRGARACAERLFSAQPISERVFDVYARLLLEEASA